jgi:uncharacterized protein YbjT (DUF2867 family)
MKKAILIGATGLVGGHLLNLLLDDPDYEKVTVFTRRSTGKKHSKLEEHIIDFDDVSNWQKYVRGDVFFSCLGTTLRKAGGKDAQYKVDFHFQYAFAKAASENGVPIYVLVSSAGADTNSMVFYSRMKGELEREVKKLPFHSICIMQPGMLVGKRESTRIGEVIGEKILNAVSAIPGMGKWKPIEGLAVAKSMLKVAAQGGTGVSVYKLDELF